MVPIWLSKILWRAGVGIDASVTCREGAFTSSAGPQGYLFLIKWLLLRSDAVVDFQSIKTSWLQGVVRRAPSYEQNLETGYVTVQVTCSFWAAHGTRGWKSFLMSQNQPGCQGQCGWVSSCVQTFGVVGRLPVLNVGQCAWAALLGKCGPGGGGTCHRCDGECLQCTPSSQAGMGQCNC